MWETCDFLNCVHDFLTKSDWRSITPELRHIYLRLLPLTYGAFLLVRRQAKCAVCLLKKDGIDFEILVDSFSSGFFISES